MAAKDLVLELEQTRQLLEILTDEVERNTEILRHSQARELELLQAEDLSALFAYLLDGLAASYALDATSVVLWDPDYEIRHLAHTSQTDIEGRADLRLVDTLQELTSLYSALEQPWLGRYSPVEHAGLLSQEARLQSVAIIPLRREGRLLGSLNFGSCSPSRFTPEHAADFFAHLGVIASFALENAVNRERLTRSGFTDVLTGWYNRRYLKVRIAEELARARRDGVPLACLMLDIDHFKQVNDSRGHAIGDLVLQEVAQRVAARIRATDVAARYGGEEFIILLPATTARQARKLANAIRKDLARTAVPVEAGSGIPVTASIGIAALTPARDCDDLRKLGDALIARADKALYQAKSAGRNRVVVAEDS